MFQTTAALELLVLFQRNRKLYLRCFESLLSQRNMTQMEMDVLLFLANNPQYTTAADLVRVRGLTKSHVSLAVDSLTRQGYLRWEQSPANRKQHSLTLLPPAAELVAAGRACQQTYGSLLSAGISPEEQAACFAVLRHMADNARIALEREEL